MFVLVMVSRFLERIEKHSRTVVRLTPNSPPWMISFCPIPIPPPPCDVVWLVLLSSWSCSASLSSNQTSSSPTKYSRNNPLGISTEHCDCFAKPCCTWNVSPFGPAYTVACWILFADPPWTADMVVDCCVL